MARIASCAAFRDAEPAECERVLRILIDVGPEIHAASRRAMSRALREGLPHARLEVLPGASRFGLVESREAWALAAEHIWVETF
jgi:hypothetical protein